MKATKKIQSQWIGALVVLLAACGSADSFDPTLSGGKSDDPMVEEEMTCQEYGVEFTSCIEEYACRTGDVPCTTKALKDCNKKTRYDDGVFQCCLDSSITPQVQAFCAIRQYKITHCPELEMSAQSGIDMNTDQAAIADLCCSLDATSVLCPAELPPAMS